MKKRKPPVVLASVLIVLVGLAVVLFPKEQSMQDMQQQESNTAEKAVPTGQSRATPSKEELAARLKQAEKKNPGRSPEDMGGPAETTANAVTATVLIPKYNPVKQVPNDASVSQQWYRDNARASQKNPAKGR